MRRRRPRSVTVHGTKYTIKYVTSIEDGEGNGAYGCCEPDSCCIYIARGSEERERKTLEHEVAHAAFHETGFGHFLQLAVKDAATCEVLEEDFVRRVAPAYLASVAQIGHNVR